MIVDSRFLLDKMNPIVIMEDMRGYEKLTELLRSESQGLEAHMVAVERAMHFMGHVHRQTWLAKKTEQEAKVLLEKFR